jgi:pSer/pThr/pTyr-binding forkhead associated (FHA) protein
MTKKLLIINPQHYMEVPFDQQLTIGRDVYNSLSLQDAEISRSHAIIYEQGSRTLIRDLSSRNGVYVNGDRVTEQTIDDGDEIILGSTIIIFNPAEGVDIEKRLSRRGEYLFERRAVPRTDEREIDPVTIFTADQMERVIHRLFNDPENTTFFTLTNAMALLRGFYSMGHTTNTADLFRVTLEQAMQLIGGDHGVIMEADMNKEKLKVKSIHATGDQAASIEVSQQVLRVVLRAERCVYCPNIARDNRFSKIADRSRHKIHSFVASPIMIGKNYFGFIYLHSESKKHEYTYVALRSLYFLASHLGSLLQPHRTHFVHQADPSDSQPELVS